MTKWRKADGFAKLVYSVLGGSGHDDMGNEGDYFKEKDKKMGTNIRQCFHKVVDRHFTTSVKVLGHPE